jgi:large subunit ribosomal protein L25
MAREIAFDAEPRPDRGKSAARKLRATGRLPAVIYGTGIDSIAIALNTSELVKALHEHGAHPLVTVKVGSDEHLALVKEIQVDALSQTALHADFLRVQANVAVHTEAALHLVGTPEGVKLGGILETLLHTLAIEALPRSIPESIEHDVSALVIGDVVRVSEIKAPAGVTILTDPEETVATVSAPRVEVEEAPAAEEAEEGAEAAEGEAEAGEEKAED